MNVIDILKAPFKGSFSNSKLKINESIVINLILSATIAIVFGIITMIMAKNAMSAMRNSLSSVIGVDTLFSYMAMYSGISRSVAVGLIKILFMFIINLMGIIFVFSGIMCFFSNILSSKISYEKCLSICAFANIIPSAIMLVGIIVSMFSSTLCFLMFFLQFSLSIILIYEGFSEELTAGKSKIISSIGIGYVLNTIIFLVFNYIVIVNMIASGLRSMF